MTEQQQILIVEDEPNLAKLLQDYLIQSGFKTQIIEDGALVIDWIKANSVDLIVLDLMLPNRDGIEICKELRGFSDVPVVMATAKIEEVDRLIGLEIGADDYICKPYSPREVVARIKALLRRIKGFNISQGQRLEIDMDGHEVVFLDQRLELTPVEFRLLAALNQQPGKVYSRAQLMKHIYTDHRVVTDRTVDSHVKNLRKKLQGVSEEEEWVDSIYGVGYRLNI